MDYFYLQEISEPVPGAIFLGENRFVFPRDIHIMPGSVVSAVQNWLVKVEGSYTVTADSDGGCDRICEYTDYVFLEYKNVILRNDTVVGFFLPLEYYYSISPERPNIIIFSLENPAPIHHPSEKVFTLIPREPGMTYTRNEHIY